MKNKKKVIITLAVIFTLFTCGWSSCGNESAQRDKEYSEEVKSQAADKHGYPEIVNFFEYAQLKEIYEMRDDPNLICYWYVMNEHTGNWHYQGKCIGFGIPYAASITSPDTPYYNGCSITISQAEPNAIYTNGLTTSATWITSVDDKGNISTEYVEQPVRVTQNKIPKEMCEGYLPDDY